MIGYSSIQRMTLSLILLSSLAQATALADKKPAIDPEVRKSLRLLDAKSEKVRNAAVADLVTLANSGKPVLPVVCDATYRTHGGLNAAVSVVQQIRPNLGDAFAILSQPVVFPDTRDFLALDAYCRYFEICHQRIKTLLQQEADESDIMLLTPLLIRLMERITNEARVESTDIWAAGDAATALLGTVAHKDARAFRALAAAAVYLPREGISQRHFELRNAATEALGKAAVKHPVLRKNVIPILAGALLESKHPGVLIDPRCVAALGVVGNLGTDAAPLVPLINQLTQHRYEDVSGPAQRALQELGL